MSGTPRSVVAAALGSHVLDSKLRDLDLADYHVAFDDIHGDRLVEAELARAVQVYERTCIIGPIGGGKTSVARYVLDRMPEESRIAPVWVSVAFDGPEVITDPRRFTAHIIQAIVKQAGSAVNVDRDTRERILAGATAERPLPAVSRKTGGQLAAKWWVINAGIAKDVTRTLDGAKLDRPLADILDAANAGLAAIAAHGLLPVLVIDDSDLVHPPLRRR